MRTAPKFSWLADSQFQATPKPKTRKTAPERSSGQMIGNGVRNKREKAHAAQSQLTVTEPKMSNPDQVNASEIGNFQFCQEAWRRQAWWKQESAKREQRVARRGDQRRDDDPRQRGTRTHAAWQKKRRWLSGIMAWGGRGVVGGVGVGLLGLALDQLDVPVNRGLLLDANLVVEVAGALLVSALVVFVETWCWWYRAGFGLGWTLSADDIMLRSPALGLVGKPDRIVLRRGFLIPEEKKSGRDVYDSYTAQMDVYLVLIEEFFEKRPPYGFLVLKNGQREKITNKDRRVQVTAMAQAIRTARTNLRKPLAGADDPKKCGGCRESKYCTVKPSGAQTERRGKDETIYFFGPPGPGPHSQPGFSSPRKYGR